MANERIHISDLETATSISNSDYLVVETPTETKKIAYSDIIPPDMTGADGTNAGTRGLVPAPTATDNTKFLRGDGTWGNIGEASTTADGLMSAEDKTKLNGIETGAQVNPPTMTGATSSADGASGLVPKPLAGDDDAYLKGDGTWASVPSGSTVTAQLYTITASGWSSGRYSFETAYPSANYNIQIAICEQTTTAQRTAFANAGIIGSSTNNSIVATGTVPTVDIVVLLMAFTK